MIPLMIESAAQFIQITLRESGLFIRCEVRYIVQDKDRMIFAVNDNFPLIYRLKWKATIVKTKFKPHSNE